jgi:quercetin dioxygenase-like cupin family protein
MRSLRVRVSRPAAFLCAALLGVPAAPAQVSGETSHPAARERARVVLSRILPKLDGNHLKAIVVEVNYGPGESSPPHRHPCAVIGYVAEGAVRTQIAGEPETIHSAGEVFYEAPQAVHAVSANASQTDRARLIAYFVCDHEAPLSVDEADIAKPGVK